MADLIDREEALAALGQVCTGTFSSIGTTIFGMAKEVLDRQPAVTVISFMQETSRLNPSQVDILGEELYCHRCAESAASTIAELQDEIARLRAELEKRQS